jgi:hypothetical protein
MKPTLTLLTSLVLAGILFCLLLASCSGGDNAAERTPIPTPIPATPGPSAGSGKLASLLMQDHCTARALDLLGAWAAAKYPEKDPFSFADALTGKTCSATYAVEITDLMHQSNVWYTGALACTTCHGPDLKASWANLDLSTYEGITTGSRRSDPTKKGSDILGGGDWQKAKLYQVLGPQKFMPFGRPASMPEKGPLIPAGKPK